jgi:hypothetical protein
VSLLLQLAEQRCFLGAGDQNRLAGGAGVMEIPDLGAAQMMVNLGRRAGAAGLGERLAVERHRRLAIAHQDLLAAELHEISGAAIEPGGAAVALFRQAPSCKDKDKREEAVLRLFCAAAMLILGAAPVLAAESCEQALKDTTAGSKTAIIGPKETEKVADLLKRAEPLCKGDAQQQAEGIALLRLARSRIGE